MTVTIKALTESDIPIIVKAFENSNWTVKPPSLFERYLKEQSNHERLVWLASFDNQFAGYVTLVWHSQYLPFKKANIPEIVDLNVLPNFRKKGTGTMLINEAEEMAKTNSKQVGIGVGLYPDYGSAQRLYIKLGYRPDGHGVTYQYQWVTPGKIYPIDDDLVLWMTKNFCNK